MRADHRVRPSDLPRINFFGSRKFFLPIESLIANSAPVAASDANQPTKMKLIHNQEIRVKGFKYANKITVSTVRGWAASKYQSTEASIEEEVSRAKALGHDMVWALQEAAALTENYPGKAEELARKAAATAAASEVADGDIVEIEGRTYKVRVMGEQYCDPVHFIRVSA